MLLTLFAHDPCADVNFNSLVSLSAPLSSQWWHHHCFCSNWDRSVCAAQPHPADSWEQLSAVWDPGADPSASSRPSWEALLSLLHTSVVWRSFLKPAICIVTGGAGATGKVVYCPFLPALSDFKYCGLKLSGLRICIRLDVFGKIQQEWHVYL